MDEKQMNKDIAKHKKAQQEMYAKRHADDVRMHSENSPMKYDHKSGSMKEMR